MKQIKLIFALTLLFIFTFYNYSQTEKAPKIFCEKPTYDFGSVHNLKTIKYKFVIENIGDEVLEILNISVSCGCTVAEIKNKNILPGKKTDIKAKLDLSRWEGAQEKEITIETNDPENKYFKLYLKGIVKNRLAYK